MTYVKGLMPKAKVPDFCKHLEKYDFIVIDGKSQWEMAQVMLDNRFQAITVDSKGVIGIPKMLEFQASLFLGMQLVSENAQSVITDSQRLDFMLDKCRKVVTEISGFGDGITHYEIYVEEGYMSDKTYKSVKHSGDDFSRHGELGHQLQRQAIDLAIKEFNSDQSTEKDPD